MIPDGSHMVADNLANIGVLLDMQGAFRPGNSEGIGRVDLFDYQNSEHQRAVCRVAWHARSMRSTDWCSAATRWLTAT